MKKNILSQKYYQDSISQELIKLIEKNIPNSLLKKLFDHNYSINQVF